MCLLLNAGHGSHLLTPKLLCTTGDVISLFEHVEKETAADCEMQKCCLINCYKFNIYQNNFNSCARISEVVTMRVLDRHSRFLSFVTFVNVVQLLMSITPVLADNGGVTSDPVDIVDYLKNKDNFAYDGYRDVDAGIRNQYAVMLVVPHGQGVQLIPESDYIIRPLIGEGTDGDPHMRIMKYGDQLVFKALPKKKGTN